jgi:hypothetical protein
MCDLTKYSIIKNAFAHQAKAFFIKGNKKARSTERA